MSSLKGQSEVSWVVVDDSLSGSAVVKGVASKAGVPITHLHTPETPKPYAQINKALDWIRFKVQRPFLSVHSKFVLVQLELEMGL